MKMKRILSILGVIFLVGLYLSSFIFALIDSPLATNLLLASILSTLFIPVIIYAIQLMARVLKPKDKEE